MSLRTVKLYGKLGKRYGRVHELDVSSPAEAVRALCVLVPGFKQELATAHERGVAYRCIVDGDDIDENDLTAPMSRVFQIVPVVMGAGFLGGLFKAILGVALIVVGGAVAMVPGLQGVGAAIISAGVALTFSGVASMLTPTPKANDDKSKTQNNVFDGAVNTVAQGNPVPIGYGRLIVGSAVINAAVSVADQNATGTGFMGGMWWRPAA